jgi:hypothetical protein
MNSSVYISLIWAIQPIVKRIIDIKRTFDVTSIALRIVVAIGVDGRKIYIEACQMELGSICPILYTAKPIVDDIIIAGIEHTSRPCDITGEGSRLPGYIITILSIPVDVPANSPGDIYICSDISNA